MPFPFPFPMPGLPGMPPMPLGLPLGGPSSGGGIGAVQAGQDPRRSLFCGNLSPFVSEGLLYHIFASCGPVAACRIIKDKAGESSKYGFIDFLDHATAAHALQVLNGRIVFGLPMVTKWATGASNPGVGGAMGAPAESHQIYVGNLSPDIDDQALFRVFSAFKSISEARIVRDPVDGSSKCYGFVTFRTQHDAEQAMVQMNGEWLGKRAMRINQANNAKGGGDDGLLGFGAAGAEMGDPNNCTVYIGGVTLGTSEFVIRQALEDCGRVVGVRVHDGFAFVDMGTHDEAVRAIATKNGTVVGNKTVKLSWSKFRPGA
jgi:nucleolysin TIA-1/TIAR